MATTIKIKNHNRYPVSVPSNPAKGLPFITLVPENVTIEDSGLAPGVTRVNADAWKEAKKLDAIKRRMSAKGGHQSTLEEV